MDGLMRVDGWGDVMEPEEGLVRSWDYVAPVMVGALALMWTVGRWVWHENPKRVKARALADHPIVPMWARVLVPAMLWGGVALFAFSNSTLGARVRFEAQVLGHRIARITLFDFSLANTVTEMLQAQVYGLGILVLLWSGIWPYLKSALMLGMWYLPPSILRRDHRRRMLLTLDVLGKWALIDLFLMTMMSVAFHFHISTSTISERFLGDAVVVEVSVTPERGLYTLVTAVALSLLSNHLILAFHRNACGADDVWDGSDGLSYADHRKSLSLRGMESMDEHLLSHDALRRESMEGEDSDDEFARISAMSGTLGAGHRACCRCPDGSWFERGTLEAYRSGDARAIEMADERISVLDVRFSPGALPSAALERVTGKPKVWVGPLLAGAIFAVTVLICVSVTEDTFEFVFKGLAGTMIALVDPEQKTRRCSIYSIAGELGRDAGPDANQWGVLYLQVFYVLFSIMFPLVVILIASLALCVPLRLREVKITFYSLEVVMAWASLDVFIVAIIASILQIKRFSAFLEGDLCDPIKRALPIEDCFIAETKLLPGCWIVLFTACALWVVMQIILRFLERAIAEREIALLSLVRLIARGSREFGG